MFSNFPIGFPVYLPPTREYFPLPPPNPPPLLREPNVTFVIDLSARAMKAYRIGNTPFRFCSCRSTFMSLVMKYVVFNADFIAFSKFPSAPDRFAIRNGSGGGPKDSFPQSTY